MGQKKAFDINAPMSWHHFLTGVYVGAYHYIIGSEFQCPEGLVPFSNVLDAYSYSRDYDKFQCPEGLVMLSNSKSSHIHSCIRMRISFNTPKGWYHFLTFGLAITYEMIEQGFNAPKGWYHFLTGNRKWYK